MNKKYLYGKKCNLNSMICGEAGPRFSDISHYARLENDLMRDEETAKEFVLDRHAVRLEINGHVLNPDDMVDDLVISLPVQPCYCLCLSNKKNCDELFEKFNADICIEIDIDKLLDILKSIFSEVLKGMEVEANNITYYEPSKIPPTQDIRSLVFYKPECFKHEDEYRIAIFYPADKKGFKGKNGEIIPFQKEDESVHIELSCKDSTLAKEYILGFYERQ